MAYHADSRYGGSRLGQGCGCIACNSAARRLGESYEPDDDEDDDAPAPAARAARPAVPPRPAPSRPTPLGEPPVATAPAVTTTPAFRFFCPGNCAPEAANRCRTIVEAALRDATWLADNAAARLEARDAEAVRLFRFFFGDPERAVPWAGNRPAADLVAGRYRSAANGFRTRVPHVRCSARADCNAFTQARAAPSAANPLPRNTILLCRPFWGGNPPGTTQRFWRAAIVLHEMLHLLYWQFFGHQANLPRPGDPEERRRDNSHCYEAFALRVAGEGADAFDVTACRARPF